MESSKQVTAKRDQAAQTMNPLSVSGTWLSGTQSSLSSLVLPFIAVCSEYAIPEKISKQLSPGMMTGTLLFAPLLLVQLIYTLDVNLVKLRILEVFS
ncbi:hypothetical protein ACFX2B_039335 [Malus domestica]